MCVYVCICIAKDKLQKLNTHTDFTENYCNKAKRLNTTLLNKKGESVFKCWSGLVEKNWRTLSLIHITLGCAVKLLHFNIT